MTLPVNLRRKEVPGKELNQAEQGKSVNPKTK
jgi:hypothetical protein